MTEDYSEILKEFREHFGFEKVKRGTDTYDQGFKDGYDYVSEIFEQFLLSSLQKVKEKKYKEGYRARSTIPINAQTSKCPYTNGEHLIDYGSGSYSQVCRKCGMVLKS